MKKIGKSLALDLVAKGALLVDMRSPVAYRDGHVTGAINLPLLNFVNRIMPMDKKSKIIIYSDESTDPVLRQGLNYAENLGFTTVYVSDFKSLTQEAVAPTPVKEVKRGRNRRKQRS